MALKQLGILTIFSLLASQAIAHPVAFEGALSLMSYNQADMSDWQIAYSVTPKFALGIDYYRDSMAGVTKNYFIPRVNWLVQRWNGKDHQANIYLSAGY